MIDKKEQKRLERNARNHDRYAKNPLVHKKDGTIIPFIQDKYNYSEYYNFVYPEKSKMYSKRPAVKERAKLTLKASRAKKPELYREICRKSYWNHVAERRFEKSVYKYGTSLTEILNGNRGIVDAIVLGKKQAKLNQFHNIHNNAQCPG